MPERYVGVVSVRKRGVITLPAELRRRLRLDEEGSRLEIVERDDGVVELRPSVVVPADQAWFWTERWQAMEREADDDIAAGRVERADTVEELVEILDNQG
jgi:AbrB family looped-hinge helix DNA binding protein